MDWTTFWTIIGVVAATIGIVYQFLRNFKSDIKSMIDAQDKKFDAFERKFELLDNRIFQLAMGKSLKDIMQEEKNNNKCS